MARLFSVKRPDNFQEEVRVLFGAQHDCPQAFDNMRNGLPRDDELLFPVGIFGAGIQQGVPFEVQTTEACGACNTILKAWFEWKGAKVIDLGAVSRG